MDRPIDRPAGARHGRPRAPHTRPTHPLAGLALSRALATERSPIPDGAQVGYLIHFSCTFVTGLCVGVKYSAALAATMLALTPALAFSSSYLTRRMGRLGIRSQVASSPALKAAWNFSAVSGTKLNTADE